MHENSFELSLKELETVVDALGQDTVTLDDAITLYKKGIGLVKTCNDAIDKVEKELMVLRENPKDE